MTGSVDKSKVFTIDPIDPLLTESDVLKIFQEAVDDYYAQHPVGIDDDDSHRGHNEKYIALRSDWPVDKPLTLGSVLTPSNIPALAELNDDKATRVKREIFSQFLDILASKVGKIENQTEAAKAVDAIQTKLFRSPSIIRVLPSGPNRRGKGSKLPSIADEYKEDSWYDKVVIGDPAIKPYPPDVLLKSKEVYNPSKRERTLHILNRERKRYLPITVWLPQETWRMFLKDLIAGTTVACTLIPQALAYATLAGLPQQYGLYVGLLPQVIYAIFGTSREAAFGPVAVISLLLNQATAKYSDVTLKIQAALVVTFMVGIINLAMGLFRLGWVTNFLSHPVLIGFMAGAGLTIAASQTKDIFGISVPRDIANGPAFDNYIYQLKNLGSTIWQTFLFGIVSLILLLTIRAINKRFKILIPGPLVVVIVATVVSSQLKLNPTVLAVVGDLPRGLPSWEVPHFDSISIGDNIGTIISIALIGYMETVAIGKQFARKKGYKIDPSQELIAIGMANTIGSFNLCFASCVSFSRTAINAMAGAQSNVTKFVVGFWVMLALLVLTPLVKWLPKPTLAAIIIVAVLELVDISAMIHIFHTKKLDFLSVLTTFLVVFFLGVEKGVGIGIGASFLYVILGMIWPRMSVLGRLWGTDAYVDAGHHKEALLRDGVVILQVRSPLYFFNTALFSTKVNSMYRKTALPPQVFILDFSCVTDMDTNSLMVMRELVEDMKKTGVLVVIVGLTAAVEELFDHVHLRTLIGPQHFYRTVSNAAAQVQFGTSDGSRKLGYEDGAVGTQYVVKFDDTTQYEKMEYAEGEGI